MREWGARFPVALVYPQIYPVAMGNLGFQAIYHLLNAQPGLVCERAFLPTFIFTEHDLVVTSYGLTAFEALAAGTPVVLLNPTRRHEKLSRRAGLASLGVKTFAFAQS